MVHIYSYPTVYAIGHSAIRDLFSGPVVVEEKIDGSQFSMMRVPVVATGFMYTRDEPVIATGFMYTRDEVVDYELVCRSKGKDLVIDAPETMFEPAVAVAKGLDLHPGWIYRCEFLAKPKHNTLPYSRTPAKGLIIYDIGTELETYMEPVDRAKEAARLGLETVPVMFVGTVHSLAELEGFLDRASILGGTKVEGVVVKNYALFTPEKKVAMGKYVSEAFKETHDVDWRKRNPTGADVVQRLIDRYRTDTRWEKAIQHLRDAGTLESSPRDIGALIKEVPADVRKECEEEIKVALFAHVWPAIQRGITRGLPEWYKQRLAESAFGEETQTPKEEDGGTDDSGRG